MPAVGEEIHSRPPRLVAVAALRELWDREEMGVPLRRQLQAVAAAEQIMVRLALMRQARPSELQEGLEDIPGLSAAMAASTSRRCNQAQEH